MVLTEEKITEFAQFLLEEEKSEITIKKCVRDVQKFCNFADKKTVVNHVLSADYSQKAIRPLRSCSNRNGVRIFEHILLMTRQKSAGGLSPVKDF